MPGSRALKASSDALILYEPPAARAERLRYRVENLIAENGDKPKALAAIRNCKKSIALGEAPVKADAGRYVPAIWESVRPSLQ